MGATVLDTEPYSDIAQTHLHIPDAVSKQTYIVMSGVCLVDVDCTHPEEICSAKSSVGSEPLSPKPYALNLKH